MSHLRRTKDGPSDATASRTLMAEPFAKTAPRRAGLGFSARTANQLTHPGDVPIRHRRLFDRKHRDLSRNISCNPPESH